MSAIVQGLGLICLVIAGWLWNTVVGIALLGGFLILVGYALDGVPIRLGKRVREDEQ